jgi:hypothetical protein
MGSSPIDSPGIRQSTCTSALDVDQEQDDTLEQGETNDTTVHPQSGKGLAADTIADCPPGIFKPLTDQATQFHVFPHKGSAKLVASIKASLMYISKLPNEDWQISFTEVK